MITKIHDWLSRPFNPTASIQNLVLTVIAILAGAWLWNSVILMFGRKAREVAGSVVSGA